MELRKKGKARYAASILGTLGLLVMSSGVALVVAAAPANAKTPVNICHATSSDTNPYVFITVDDDSAKFQGHLQHRQEPNKRWKTDGTFNGVQHFAGDKKPDLIGDYVDDQDVPHAYDGVINGESCENAVTEVPTTASVTFTDPSCANENEASYTTDAEHATFAVTSGAAEPGSLIEITATVADGFVFGEDDQTQVFTHTFSAAETECDETETPEEPTPVVDPPDKGATPTVVHAGLVSTVAEDSRLQQGLALLVAGMIFMVMAGGLGLVRPDGGKLKN